VGRRLSAAFLQRQMSKSSARVPGNYGKLPWAAPNGNDFGNKIALNR
jgi:hypothetical protein